MDIYKELQLDINKKELISFVGGGGKTTIIFQLAEELTKAKKKVLISTTTKIFIPNKEEWDYFLLKDIKSSFTPLKGTVTILGDYIKGEKLIGVNPEKIDEIVDRNIFDFILIEADGSKRKSIKAPGSHEPLIPKKTDITIGIIGLDCLNKPINEKVVHRPELLKKILGNENSEYIDENIIVNLVLSKQGLFKDSKGEKILLLNKAHDKKTINTGKSVINKLKVKNFNNIILGDIKKKVFY